MQSAVREKFGVFTAERRAETTATVRNTYRYQVEKMPLASRSRWEKFLDQMVVQCPGMGRTADNTIDGNPGDARNLKITIRDP